MQTLLLTQNENNCGLQFRLMRREQLTSKTQQSFCGNALKDYKRNVHGTPIPQLSKGAFRCNHKINLHAFKAPTLFFISNRLCDITTDEGRVGTATCYPQSTRRLNIAIHHHHRRANAMKGKISFPAALKCWFETSHCRWNIAEGSSGSFIILGAREILFARRLFYYALRFCLSGNVFDLRRDGVRHVWGFRKKNSPKSSAVELCSNVAQLRRFEEAHESPCQVDIGMNFGWL